MLQRETVGHVLRPHSHILRTSLNPELSTDGPPDFKSQICVFYYLLRGPFGSI